MTKERLLYIDIFKGLCIIFVVAHHAPLAMDGKFAEPGEYWWFINNFIITFFMPAFFIATGYCSSFDVPIKIYIWKKIKSILIPCYCLYYLNRYLQNLDVLLFGDSSWQTFSHWISPGIRTFFTEGGHYWFLSALFLSELIAWGINLLKGNKKIQWLLLYCLFIIGIVLYHTSIIPNFFFFQHALVLLPFLFIGKEIKKYEHFIERYGQIISVGFILIISLLSFFQIEIPTITRTITVSLKNSFLFLLLSILGSYTVLHISKLLKTSKILEFLGRGSLVEYCFNYTTLCLVGHTVLEIESYLSIYTLSTINYMIIIIVSLFILAFFYWLLNHKYLRILIGKF